MLYQIINSFRNINYSQIILQATEKCIALATTHKVDTVLESLGFLSILAGAATCAMGKKKQGITAIAAGTTLAAGSCIVQSLRALHIFFQLNNYERPIFGIIDYIKNSPAGVIDLIKDVAIDDVPKYVFTAGAATTLGGSIDFAKGNNKRGAAIMLTGAAAIAGSYLLKV